MFQAQGHTLSDSLAVSEMQRQARRENPGQGHRTFPHSAGPTGPSPDSSAHSTSGFCVHSGSGCSPGNCSWYCPVAVWRLLGAPSDLRRKEGCLKEPGQNKSRDTLRLPAVLCKSLTASCSSSLFLAAAVGNLGFTHAGQALHR